MLLIAARRPARTDADGALVPLARAGPHALGPRPASPRVRRSCAPACGATSPARTRSRRRSTPSTATRRGRRTPTGAQILALYDQLLAFDPSPVVALNRAVAVAEVRGPGGRPGGRRRTSRSSRTTSSTPCGPICCGGRPHGRGGGPPTTPLGRAPTTRPNARSWPRRGGRWPVRTGRETGPVMKVHLVDGTYELFRHFFGAPPHRTADGHEVAAVRGVVASVLQLLTEGATHVGVATDHVIESFRNDLWPGYKTGEGVDPDLWSQAWPLETALQRAGRPGLADGRARGGRRAGQRRRRGRRRSHGGAGRHLHARQGSRPVRAGHACRPARPGGRMSSSTRAAWSPSSAWDPPPFPIIWPWWGTAPTASPACRGGAPSRRRRCWPAGTT